MQVIKLNINSPLFLKNAPEKIYYSGDINLLKGGKKMAVVGSRSIGSMNERRTELITSYLVENNFTIVSGLGVGVDTIAHKTAIRNKGNTIAVIGTSLDNYFPLVNKELQDYIAEKHLLLTQFSPDTPTERSNFPIRNRLMALLSDASLIVTARANSGTKHQALETIRLKKPLFMLENVIKDNPKVDWIEEVLDKGAIIITKENYKQVISETI